MKEKAEKEKSGHSQKLEIPKVIPIDLSVELYERTKTNIIKSQDPRVRPHLLEFIRWLKNLDALSVYDALEKGETIKEKYDAMRFNPVRITIVLARGLLKGYPRLRAKAEKSFSLDLARLVVRFENPQVWQVLKQFDPHEEFLRRNIQALKQILSLIEVEKD